MNAPTRSGWLLFAVVLTALDLVVITLPASLGIHLGETVIFGLAVLALVAAVLAAFTKGSPLP